MWRGLWCSQNGEVEQTRPFSARVPELSVGGTDHHISGEIK